MFNILLVLAIVSTVVSIAALVIGCTALAFVIGLKNSTHNVVWKEAPKLMDPFTETEEEKEEITENVNKRFKKFSNDELKPRPETDLVDLDSPEVTSNFN